MSRFVSIAEARASRGLRMVCLRGVPSPWTEAAKGIFHVKQLDCCYAAQRKGDEADALAAWAGSSSVPVVAYENEPLRTGWAQILLLAERLADAPPLIPAQPSARALMFGLSHEICGEMGFGWCLRLEMLKQSMGHGAEDQPGFPPEVAARLAARYGFNPRDVAKARGRVLEILSLLDETLGAKTHMLGDSLTALDIYWATFANLLAPLPEDMLPAVPLIRNIYTTRDQDLAAALTPKLRDHQRFIYETYLELPVPL